MYLSGGGGGDFFARVFILSAYFIDYFLSGQARIRIPRFFWQSLVCWFM